MDLMQNLIASKLIGGGSSSELPDVTNLDNGKALGVVEGAWDKMDIPTELPTVDTTDNGKVLKVTEGVWAKGDVPSELPTVTSSDEGKVLTVDSNGAWGADNPSGGLPEVTSSDNDKILSVVNGVWDKATLPSDVAIYSMSGSSSGWYLQSGITTTEIATRIQTGTKLVLLRDSSSNNLYYPVNKLGQVFMNIKMTPDSNKKQFRGNVRYEFTVIAKSSNTMYSNYAHGYIPEIPYVTKSDSGKSLIVNSEGDYVLQTILPSVTSSDEGKVLTVNSSGQWVAQTSSGGKITLICDSVGGGKYNLPNNMTQQDVKTMLDNGSEIEVKIIITTGVDRIFRRCYLNNNTYEFLTMYYESNKFYASYFKIENNNNTQIELLTNNISN